MVVVEIVDVVVVVVEVTAGCEVVDAGNEMTTEVSVPGTVSVSAPEQAATATSSDVASRCLQIRPTHHEPKDQATNRPPDQRPLLRAIGVDARPLPEFEQCRQGDSSNDSHEQGHEEIVGPGEQSPYEPACRADSPDHENCFECGIHGVPD